MFIRSVGVGVGAGTTCPRAIVMNHLSGAAAAGCAHNTAREQPKIFAASPRPAAISLIQPS